MDTSKKLKEYDADDVAEKFRESDENRIVEMEKELLGREEKSLEFHEIEVKFRIDEKQLNDWKDLVRKYRDEHPEEYRDFIYVDSDDDYYVNPHTPKGLDYQFIRHRFSDDKKNKRAELTTKKKLTDSNNIIRREWNVRIDNNDKGAVKSWITEGLDYEYAFKITKYVQIYKFKDATLPFYTVIDEKGKRDTFIEVEVDEELLAKDKITEDQAWDIIRKYEAILAPLGVTARNRLRKSLFEMYYNPPKKD